jgi:hypothetical protein
MAKPVTEPPVTEPPVIKPPVEPWVVEFVGLPGAGKTTVFHPVVSQLAADGISLVTRDEILQQWQKKTWVRKIWQLMPGSQNHFSILIQALELALQVKPRTRQSFSKAGKIFSNLKRIDSTIRHRRYPLIVLDQGLLQEIWSVGITGSPPSATQIMPVLTSLSRSRSLAVVHFQIDIETARDRLQSRSSQSSRLDLMQPEAAAALLCGYAPYLQDILDCARSLNIPILQIDGSLPVEAKAETIARWIASLVAGSSINR